MNDKKKNSAVEPEQEEATSLSRRGLLKGVGLTGAALMAAGNGSVMMPVAQAQGNSARIHVTEALETLTAAESAALDALVSRILPSDDGTPGAHEARAVHFIDRGLTGAMSGSRAQYAIGLAALDALAMARNGTNFSGLPASAQDEIIQAMTENANADFPMLNAGFFNTVRNHTIEGCFSDPYYGGNRDFVGWDLIGYPGVRIIATVEETSLGRDLAPSRQSAYDMPAHTKDPAGPASGQQGGSFHD
jgi:gluconate 2-dehydrogenase gamma chain